MLHLPLVGGLGLGVSEGCTRRGRGCPQLVHCVVDDEGGGGHQICRLRAAVGSPQPTTHRLTRFFATASREGVKAMVFSVSALNKGNNRLEESENIKF